MQEPFVRVTSTANRIGRAWAARLFFTFIVWDFILLIAAAGLFGYYHEKEAFGEEWILRLERDIVWEQKTYRFRMPEEEWQEAYFGSILSTAEPFAAAVLVLQGITLIDQSRIGKKKARQLLKPLDKMAKAARELARLRITLDDLSSQLRLKNFPSLNDVDYAVLEPNGDLSVIPKYEKAAVTRADLGCGKKPQELPLILIADGAFCRSNLQKAGFSKESLLEQLRKQGAPELSRIFLCYRDETGTLQTYLREQFDLEEVPPCAHC